MLVPVSSCLTSLKLTLYSLPNPLSEDRMMARTSLLVCLLAASSYAFAVQQPATFAARSAALRMTGGDAPPPPPVDLKVRQ